MNEEDNCATSLTEIPQNEVVKINENIQIKVNQKIPFGHKIALKDINKGDYIIKYGESIGIATKDIKSGDWIHTQNVVSAFMEEQKI